MNSQAIEMAERAERYLDDVEELLRLRDHFGGMSIIEKHQLESRISTLTKELRKIRDRRPIGTPCSNSPNNSHLPKDGIMHIEFETEVSGKLTFGMVRGGQLFVSVFGDLYQKSWDEADDENNAWRISNSDGEPRGGISDFDPEEEIKRILPPIRRIAY